MKINHLKIFSLFFFANLCTGSILLAQQIIMKVASQLAIKSVIVIGIKRFYKKYLGL
jgi:hypothetical protein